MSEYKGKRIAIAGLSVEGMDSALYFAKQEADIICLDRRTKNELGDAYERLSAFASGFQLGAAYLSRLENYDYVVRTSGMSLRTPELLSAQKNGVTITSQTKLFFKHCKAAIIGVTGTKGKGTISALIYEMLKQSGRKAFLGGNIGTPLLSKVDEIQSSDIVVLELSSFQLEDLTQSPHIAVVQKITQDHLANTDALATNFHPSVDAYREAKTPIVRHQTSSDYVIVNADDPVSERFVSLTKAKPYRFSRFVSNVDAYVENNAVYMRHDTEVSQVCTNTDIQLRGAHNLENIAAASLTASVAGVSLSDIHTAAKHFQGLEHRLKLVGTVRGVSYYDDSFSTIPETTIAAIQSFENPVVLIAGGSEKKSDFTQLGIEIAKSSVKEVLLMGEMTKRIADAVGNSGFKGHISGGYASMHDIVQSASQKAVAGDVVLLSPACASFGMFRNYKERGDKFKYEVTSLAHQ